MTIYECCTCKTRQTTLRPDPPIRCIKCLVGFAFLRVIASFGKDARLSEEVINNGKKEHSKSGF
jgi:hypothetical protein